MRNYFKVVSFSIFLLICNSSWGQTAPENIVNDFYKWYFSEGHSKLKPKYVESPNGMAAINFEEYDKYLTSYRFNTELIEKSKKRYAECQRNLVKIRFDDFLKFEDIDEFNEIGCDFQSYPWFEDSMEPLDYYLIDRLEKVNQSEIKVFVKLGFNELQPITVVVTLQSIDNEWLIMEFNS